MACILVLLDGVDLDPRVSVFHSHIGLLRWFGKQKDIFNPRNELHNSKRRKNVMASIFFEYQLFPFSYRTF